MQAQHPTSLQLGHKRRAHTWAIDAADAAAVHGVGAGGVPLGQQERAACEGRAWEAAAAAGCKFYFAKINLMKQSQRCQMQHTCTAAWCCVNDYLCRLLHDDFMLCATHSCTHQGLTTLSIATQIYDICIHEFRHRHAWMGFIDADEFLVLRNRSLLLPSFLQVTRHVLCSSGR